MVVDHFGGEVKSLIEADMVLNRFVFVRDGNWLSSWGGPLYKIGAGKLHHDCSLTDHALEGADIDRCFNLRFLDQTHLCINYKTFIFFIEAKSSFSMIDHIW